MHCSNLLLLSPIKFRLVALFILLFSANEVIAQQLPFLKLGEDRSHLKTDNGEPFFWLGDTAWELVHRLDRNEVAEYLNNERQRIYCYPNSCACRNGRS